MMAGIFDEIFGLPTHPLAVHAPIALIPIVAVATIVFVVRPPTTLRVAATMAGIVFALVVGLFAAKESGEALLTGSTNLFGTQSAIEAHQSLGNTTFVLGIVWFLLTAGIAGRVWQRNRAPVASPLSADAAPAGRDNIATAIAVLAAVTAVLTTIWLVRTGHAGAEMRWNV